MRLDADVFRELNELVPGLSDQVGMPLTVAIGLMLDEIKRLRAELAGFQETSVPPPEAA